MTDLPRPSVIRGSRAKAFKVLALGVIFEAVIGFAIYGGLNGVVGAIGMIAVLSYVGPGAYGLVVPPTLTIDDHGLRWRGFRSWQVAWCDVRAFTLWQSRKTSLVRIDYAAESRGRARAPAAIPNALWMEPTELAALLAFRLAAARAAGVAPPEDVAPRDPEPQLPAATWPWLSLGLVVVLTAVFVAEVMLPVTPADAPLVPSTITLISLGALGRDQLTGPGQWYRFVTAPFLHGSLAHLLGNGVGLLLAGRLLEGVVGTGWFAAIYVVGALAGCVGSLLFNPPDVVTVGASGAIVALFAAAFVCSRHYPRFGGRQRLQTRAVAVLLPTLLDFGKTRDGLSIDFGAHLGGAVGGLLAGLILLRIWRKPMLRPPFQAIGAAIGGAGLLAAILAIWPVMTRDELYTQMAKLVPDALMPRTHANAIAEAAELQKRYPDDPRLHLAVALGAMGKEDFVGAAAEASRGLDDMEAVRPMLKPFVEAELRLVLGESCMRRGMNDVAAANFDKAEAIEPNLPQLGSDQIIVRLMLGQREKALDEALKATERQPDAPQGWKLLGDVRFARREIAEAGQAYQRTIALAPTPTSIAMRGLTRFYSGDGDGAVSDLEAAPQDGSQGLYAALWLDIVTERNGGAPSLTDAALPDEDQPWPAPIVRFYRGRLTQADLLRQALTSEPKPGAAQSCEAGFYIAEWNAIHDRRNEAERGFRQASTDCPPDFIEAWMAGAELGGTAPDTR